VCKVLEVKQPDGPASEFKVLAYASAAKETSTKCVTSQWISGLKNPEISWVPARTIISAFEKLTSKKRLFKVQAQIVFDDDVFSAMQEQEKPTIIGNTHHSFPFK
jgi:hypothetical protein